MLTTETHIYDNLFIVANLFVLHIKEITRITYLYGRPIWMKKEDVSKFFACSAFGVFARAAQTNVCVAILIR